MNEFTPERNAPNYNYGIVKTPFSLPQQQYDAPLGGLVNKARFWRTLSIACLAASLILTIVLLLIARLPEQVVFAAGISPQNGQISVFGELRHVVDFSNNLTVPQLKQHLDNYLQQHEVK